MARIARIAWKRLLFSAFATVLVAGSLWFFTLTTPDTTRAQTGDWPTFRHSSERSGYNPDQPSLNLPMELSWSYPLPSGDQEFASPVVYEGSVFMGGNDGRLRAFAEINGLVRWSYPTGSPIHSTAAVWDGIAYVGNNAGNFYALGAADGDLKWTYNADSAIKAAPAVLNGWAYIATEDGRVYGLDANTGAASWSYAVDGAVSSSPAATGDAVYVATETGKLYAFTAASGELRWSFTGAGPFQSTPTVSGSTVYLGSDDGNIYAINTTTGTIRWTVAVSTTVANDNANDDCCFDENAQRRSIGTGVRSSPAFANGVLYVAGLNGAILALNTIDGSQRWRTEAPEAVYASPTVAGGYVFVAAYNGVLYAYDAANGAKRWEQSIDRTQSSPVVANSSLYQLSRDGTLRAFETTQLETPTATATATPTSTATPTPTPSVVLASTPTPIPLSSAPPVSSPDLSGAVAVGASPGGVAVNAVTGFVYVTNMGAGTLSVIDGGNNSVIATIPVGVSPSGLWVNTATNTIYIANQGSNNLTVLDGNTNAIKATIPVGTLPVAVTGSAAANTVYAVNQGSNTVSIIDGATDTVKETIVVGSGPAAAAYNAATNILYVANQGGGDISVINGFSNVVVASIPVGDSPTGIAVNPDTSRLYVANLGSNSVSVIDTSSHFVVATIPAGTGARAVTVFRPGNLVYVANRGSNSVSVVDGGANALLATISTGAIPTSVSANNTSRKLYVANSGSASVSVIPIVVLKSPALTAPANGARLTSLTTTLSWGLLPGVTQYQLQVVPSNNDGPAIDVIRNIEGSYTLRSPVLGSGNYLLLPGMTYTWRVRMTYAITAVGDTNTQWGPWSATQSFKTPAASIAGISLVEPAAGAQAPSRTPTLRWVNSDSSIFYYEIQVSKDPNFGSNAFLYWELRHGGLTSPLNSYTVPAAFPLEPGINYYWRVRPRVQGDGVPLSWSPAQSFHTP